MTRDLNSSTSSSISTSISKLSHIQSIQEIVDLYDVFLLDMWGVLHDGSKPYKGVIDTVKELKKRNKKIIILSNSSKRRDNSIKMLTQLGFDPSTSFDNIITSGDVSHDMLSGRHDATTTWDVLTNLRKQGKTKVFVVGSGDDDEEYVISAGWSLSSIQNADLIIARGMFTLQDGSDHIISKQEYGNEVFDQKMNDILHIAAERQLPMLITNPDKVRPDKGLPPMPGAIGDAYEKLLVGVDNAQFVKRIGKPYSEVYDIALINKDGSKIHPSKAIMVGDALETDVTGGSGKCCATLWVLLDGIHSPAVSTENIPVDAQTVLDTFNYQRSGKDPYARALKPTYVIPHFQW